MRSRADAETIGTSTSVFGANDLRVGDAKDVRSGEGVAAPTTQDSSDIRRDTPDGRGRQETVESGRAFSGPGFLIVTVSSSSMLTKSLEMLRTLRIARRARDPDRGIGAVKVVSSSLASGTTAAWMGASDDAAAAENVLYVCWVSKDTRPEYDVRGWESRDCRGGGEIDRKVGEMGRVASTGDGGRTGG